MYLTIEEQEAWPNPTISSASAKPTEVSGASGVKMTGPYDWVPPSYWMQDSTHGGAWAYNTETSPGAAVPPIESMRRMIPAQNLTWPPDSEWLFHAAGGQFAHLLDQFNNALVTRYGAPASAEDYTATAQLMTYEGERAMFEAYRRNAYTSTGVIQWMLNNAWPSIYWHLFDWYLQPAGGYFGAKKANEPVHVSLVRRPLGGGRSSGADGRFAAASARPRAGGRCLRDICARHRHRRAGRQQHAGVFPAGADRSIWRLFRRFEIDGGRRQANQQQLLLVVDADGRAL
jgi:hypothetical protein